jgi:23S rRNA pseudouridine2457 synthase
MKQNSFSYLRFFKPMNVLSQFKPLDNKSTLKDFINLENCKPTAIGRLDYDSEGLLLLTTDKRYLHFITHPNSLIKKEYIAQVEGIPTSQKLELIRNGLPDYKPAFIEIIDEPDWMYDRIPPIRFRKNNPTSWIKIIITEGKNRQVRKMTAMIGHPTLRLIRVKIDSIDLKGLELGKFEFYNPRDYNQ